MKKKILIPIIIGAVVLTCGVLFVPIPKSANAGCDSREYVALTYKIVAWDEPTADDDYEAVKVYFGEDKNKSLDELWEMELENENIIEHKEEVMRKPVIYLYPEEETKVSVNLTLDGKLTCTYPEYSNGWNVTASTDGTLTDESGQTYNYLYWEGESKTQYDFSEGFCVKGEDTAKFLEDALSKLGLNRKEANEFIVYWLPLMESNPYNIISFQTDVYTDSAKLEVNPAPDTMIRVFMAYKGADNYVEIPAQNLTAPNRTGFTVVEWGGTEVED